MDVGHLYYVLIFFWETVHQTLEVIIDFVIYCVTSYIGYISYSQDPYSHLSFRVWVYVSIT